jgi:DNA-binding transcriptional LysR family regulator
MPFETEMRVFAEVVKHRSFTKGASALGLSKSSASRLVKAFEAHFQGPLINRLPRRLDLLPLGDTVFHRVSIILRETDALLALARGQAVGSSFASVRIACSAELAGPVLQPAIATFKDEAPNIEVDVITVGRGQTAADDVDAYIGFDRSPLPQLQVIQHLGEERYAFVAAPNMLAAHRRSAPRDYEELARLPFLWIGERTKQTWSVSRRRDHWETLKLSARAVAEEPTVILHAVASAQGIGIVPTWLVSDALLEGTMARVLPRWSVRLAGQPRTLNLYSDPASPHASALHSFIAHFKSRLIDAKTASIIGKRRP